MFYYLLPQGIFVDMATSAKKLLAATFIVFSAFALSACENSSGGSEKSDTSTVENSELSKVETKKMGSSTADEEKELQKVFLFYTQVRKNLIVGDSASAHSTAKQMAQVCKNNHKKFTDLCAATSKLAAQTGLEAQRVEFANVSDVMKTTLESVGLPDGKVYVQHCPMAFDSKGADWLSDNSKIENPYFGGSMLECGEVKSIYQKN